MKMISIRAIFVLVILTLLTTLACTSRYRQKLNMTLGDETRSLGVESSRYLENTRLGDPMAEYKVIAGESAVVIIRSTARGLRLPSGEDVPTGLSFDEYLRTDLYIELPPEPGVGTLPLEGKALVHILERYDQPLEEKIYLPDNGGEITIDSIVDSHLYANIRGSFVNQNARPLVLSGGIRVRVPD